MNWKVEFYNENVQSSIKEWPDAIVPKFIWLLDLIKETGPDEVNMTYVKTLGQGLFKLSAKGDKDTGYALFCVSSQDKTIIILDSFMKTTEKSDPKVTELARSRMSELNLT